jgi:uncharacterized SAM-binding protein YcdF (DUF218 family)
MESMQITAPRDQASGSSVNRRSSVPIIAVSILITLVAGATVAFRGAGRWLVRENPLARSDVIVVLSGSMPARADEAARLFHFGYAPEVWVSKPPSPAAELASRGIVYAGEEVYSREVLIQAGVPAVRIRIFPNTAIDTEEEMRELARELRQSGKRSALIVTSPQHTRRVRALWRRIAGSDLTLIVRAAPEDSFDANHWWRNTRDAFAVVREMMGLVNAWSGLPVRPHDQPRYSP